MTRRRLAAPPTAWSTGRPTTFDEYDLFRRADRDRRAVAAPTPGSDTLGDVLRYVVRLIRTAPRGRVELPGWWVNHDPDQILPTPGGHANLGMAHGAAGLLSLLALATSHGCVVEGQDEAIERLVAWFDRWRQDSADGPWWPHWITREELRTGHPAQDCPRPAVLVLRRGGHRPRPATRRHRHRRPASRQVAAENTIAASLSDPQLHRITDPGLCHGIAGVYQTAYRAAADARTPRSRQRLPALAARAHPARRHPRRDGPGLLTGDAGVDLALETTRHTMPPHSGWDACLLIT